MVKDKIIGIDVGTTGCKVSLFSLTGDLLYHFKKDYPTKTPVEFTAEQQADDWWNAATEGIRCIINKERDIADKILAIGLSCMTPVLLPLDKNGKPVSEAHIWSDRRADTLISEIENAYGRDNFHRKTGAVIKAGYLLPKIYWQKKYMPENYVNTDCYLQPDGYIVFRLSGRKCMSKSHSEVTGMTELPDGNWSKEVCGIFDIDIGKLPEIIETDSIAGYTTSGLENICGLSEGIPIVSGGMDSALSMFAVGASEPGKACLDIGNASNLIVCADKIVFCQESDFFRYPVNGIWLYQIFSAVTGAGFRWLKDLFGSENFKELSDFAKLAKPGCNGLVFLPYFCGSQYGEGNKALWYGMNLEHRKEDMIRSVMEGCALSVRLNVETLENSGLKIEDILVSGGGSSDSFWVQMHADIIGRPLKTFSINNTAVFGAAMLARQVILNEKYQTSDKFFRDKDHWFFPNYENYNIYNKSFELYKSCMTHIQSVKKVIK